MKKTILKLFTVAVAAVMTATSFVGCGSGEGFAKDKYNIGVSGPLSGGAAVYGEAVKNGAELAIKEINAKLGDGETKYAFEMKDDEATTKNIATNFSSLYEKGMQVSLGCVTTGSCLEYKTYAKEKNVFCITPSATGDQVPENADNMYQMCFTDSNQGSASVEWMKRDNNVPTSTKIGVFYCNNDAYSKGIRDNFKAAAETAGYANITEASFANNADGSAPTDFSTQVQTLKACEFIFMPIYYTPASTFMKAAQNIVADTAKFFGCDGFDGIDTAIAGFDINTIKQEVSMLSHFNSSATTGKAADFIKAYKDEYGKTPIQFGAAAYDCVYVIYQAIEKAKADGKSVPADISASDLCNILKEVFKSASFSFDGVTGTGIKWNADGTVDKQADKFVIKAQG